MTKAIDIREFVVAGNATVTLVSRKTDDRFTFRIRATPNEADRPRQPGWPTHFVHVLTNPDNENGYTYLGNVRTFPNGEVSYDHGRKSKIDSAAPSARAFAWFFTKIVTDQKDPGEFKLPDGRGAIDVFHEGRCGACGRKLTVPESIERGIGPECYAKQGRLT
jgi:hypothetical protein